MKKYLIPKGREVRLYKSKADHNSTYMYAARTLIYIEDERDMSDFWNSASRVFFLPENDKGFKFLAVNADDVDERDG